MSEEEPTRKRLEWAPDIPPEWDVVNLRMLARIFAGGTPDRKSTDYWTDGTVPWLNSGSVNDWAIRAPSELISRAALANGATRCAPKGSVLVALAGQGKTKGMAARLEIDSTLNQSLAAIVPRPSLEYRFLQYWLTSNYLNIRGLAGGDLRDGLNLQHIGSIQVPRPPVDEQRAIADYLDRETAQIDAFIAKNEQLITLLTERAEAQHVRLILEQPIAQQVPLKAALRKLRRQSVDDAPVVTAFRDGQVTNRSNRRMEGFTETETDVRSGYQGVKVGDVVYHGLDGFAGAVGVSESDGICSPVYHVCEVTPRADAEYIALMLQTLGKSGYLEASAWSVRQRSVDYRNWSTFSRLLVDLPPVDIQREVVVEVSAGHERTTRAVSVAKRSIELARERRAALISAAVTGKIDVGVAA